MFRRRSETSGVHPLGGLEDFLTAPARPATGPFFRKIMRAAGKMPARGRHLSVVSVPGVLVPGLSDAPQAKPLLRRRVNSNCNQATAK